MIRCCKAMTASAAAAPVVRFPGSLHCNSPRGPTDNKPCVDYVIIFLRIYKRTRTRSPDRR